MGNFCNPTYSTQYTRAKHVQAGTEKISSPVGIPQNSKKTQVAVLISKITKTINIIAKV